MTVSLTIVEDNLIFVIGTVRPSNRPRTLTAVNFKFLNVDLGILMRVKVLSRQLNTKMPPISSFFGRRLVYGILSCYSRANVYLMKKSAKVLHPFGRHQTALKIHNVYFPHFLETLSLKKMAVCAHTTRLPKK